MRVATRRRLVVLWGLMVAAHSGPVHADKPVPNADLAVDVLSIKGGPRLLGASLGRELDGRLAFAVGREWLKTAHPQFFEKALADETAQTRSALMELRDRIADWRKVRLPEGGFDFFLKKESKRVETELRTLDAGTRAEDAPFLVVDVAPARLERVVNQAPQRRVVALAAWRDRLDNVESRSAASLLQELKKRKIDPAEDPQELLDLLPVRRESESAWAARRAVVEYQHRKPLDFQGSGDVVFRSDEKLQAANGAKLIEELIRSLAGGSLQDLLDPAAGKPARPAARGAPNARGAPGEKWLATAVQAAKAADVAGFRVTRVQQNVEARRVEVETRFVALLPDGSWTTVWESVEKADAAKPRDAEEQQILQDPQLRTALDLVKSLGLGGEDQVKLAVRFGAATMEAQKQADHRFFKFRDRYLQRLDGPVLPVRP